MKKKNIIELSEGVKNVVGEDHPNRNIKVDIRINQAPRIKMPDNIMVLQTFATLAAINLKPATNRVLMLLFGLSAYENFLGIDVKTISEKLNITNRSVISAMKELESNNIILKIPHPVDKRRNDYFINPLAAWKGNSYTRMKRIGVIDKNQLKLF